MHLHIETPLRNQPKKKKENHYYIYLYIRKLYTSMLISQIFFFKRFLILPLLYIIRNTRLKTNLYKDKTVQQSVGSQSVFMAQGSEALSLPLWVNYPSLISKAIKNTFWLIETTKSHKNALHCIPFIWKYKQVYRTIVFYFSSFFFVY